MKTKKSRVALTPRGSTRLFSFSSSIIRIPLPRLIISAPRANQGERLHKPEEELCICTMPESDFLSGSLQGVRHWHRCFLVAASTIRYSLCRKTFHCIRYSQQALWGNEAVLFRDYYTPPRAAKLYAPPSNPRLDGHRIYTAMPKYPSFIHRPA